MPTLGGISVWLQVGDQKLEELNVQTNDDTVAAHVEVPTWIQAPVQKSPQASSAPQLPTIDQVELPATIETERAETSEPAASLPPKKDEEPIDYSIHYRIEDTTYSYQIKTVIDADLKIERSVAGKSTGVLGAGKTSGKIDGVPVTDDWSKSRHLRFVKLRKAGDGGVGGGDVVGADGLGEINVAFYRAGKPHQGGPGTSATGFHVDSADKTVTSAKTVSEESLIKVSHSTGLGPIVFGPPQKILTPESVDTQPYVSFTFNYRARELLPEDWFIAVHPTNEEMNKGISSNQSTGLRKNRSIATRSRIGGALNQSLLQASKPKKKASSTASKGPIQDEVEVEREAEPTPPTTAPVSAPTQAPAPATDEASVPPAAPLGLPEELSTSPRSGHEKHPSVFQEVFDKAKKAARNVSTRIDQRNAESRARRSNKKSTDVVKSTEPGEDSADTAATVTAHPPSAPSAEAAEPQGPTNVGIAELAEPEVTPTAVPAAVPGTEASTTTTTAA